MVITQTPQRMLREIVPPELESVTAVQKERRIKDHEIPFLNRSMQSFEISGMSSEVLDVNYYVEV